MFKYLLILIFFLQHLFSGFSRDTLIGNTYIQHISIGSKIENGYVQAVYFKQIPVFIEISFSDTLIRCSCDQLFLTHEGWKRAEHLNETDFLLTDDNQEIALQSIKLKHEKIWVYAISLTRNFLYTVTPYKIIVHNDPLVATIAFAFGEGIVFEGFTIGLAALPLLLKAGKEVYSRVKSGITKARDFMRARFFDDTQMIEVSDSTVLMKPEIIPTQQNNVHSSSFTSSSLLPQDEHVKKVVTCCVVEQKDVKIDREIENIGGRECQPNCCKPNEKSMLIYSSSNGALERFEEVVEPLRKCPEYEYIQHNQSGNYTLEQMQFQQMFGEVASPLPQLPCYTNTINFNEPQFPGFEEGDSHFAVDLRSVGQYFVDAHSSSSYVDQPVEHKTRMAYEWDEETDQFVYFNQSYPSEQYTLVDQQQNKKSDDPVCCSKSCECWAQNQVNQLEHKITKKSGKRTKFDFDNERGGKVAKVPTLQEIAKGYTYKKHMEFLYDELNNVYLTRDKGLHGGIHWKVYRKILNNLHLLCEFVKLGKGYVKIINKNINKKDVIPFKDLIPMGDKKLKSIKWLDELYEPLDEGKCPCKDCPCLIKKI